MKRGYLSQYFEGVAIKKLRAVEADFSRSNQHELNGVSMLRNLLGSCRLNDYPVRLIWLGGESDIKTVHSTVTWYNSRENQTHRSAEYRLYFKKNDVMDLAHEGDLLIAAKRPNGDFFMIVVPSGSTFESQLLWLFGFSEDYNLNTFKFRNIEENNLQINFAVRFILEELGIEIEEPEPDYLDSFLEPYYNVGFPTTAEFSELSRQISKNVSPLEEPDNTLLQWIEQEERLFKRLEKHIVSKRLDQGFSGDVDGFIAFSLSVQNRRKARVGYALENHLEEIFNKHNLTLSRGKETENKAKPDFIFPEIHSYRDPEFPSSKLTMLGVKSTCKDRWRQILSEAQRIQTKHLFTLEPSISINQTNEMQAKKVNLVLPQTLHNTYKEQQKKFLMNLKDFIKLVKNRQGQLG